MSAGAFEPITHQAASLYGHKQQHFAARSKHPGGVMASRCDGSVGFYNDTIDIGTWRGLTSAAGSEVTR